MLLLAFVVTSLLLSTVISWLAIMKNGFFLEHHHKMIISMFSGSSIGLATGSMLAILYKGDLYASTISSMVTGALIAVLFCMPLGRDHMLGGLMSGLMGGMMGAMVNEMVPMAEAYELTKIFTVLMISSVFLYHIFNKAEQRVTKSWLFKHLLLFFFLTAAMVGGNIVTKAPDFHSNDLQHQHIMD
ncbi:hypothetical protein [Halobacillus salinus]|uniref:hypothetical protein n=1 Tax=Halobacillus salinus TaxID=192814 RepID=UPI0009A560C3|nr:hypothetical protein [Halobacillus salinus]